MKAFTHICRKVILSLLDDTITIYPKGESFAYLVQGFLIDQRVVTQSSIEPMYLGLKRTIPHYDVTHDQYHKDGLDKEKNHFHLQFRGSIDASCWNKIIAAFAAYSILSELEAVQCIDVYNKASEVATEKTLARPDKGVTTIGLFSKSRSQEECDARTIELSGDDYEAAFDLIKMSFPMKM